MKEKDDYLYKYYHSKPIFEINQWKSSAHSIKEFSRPDIDKIHSYSIDVKPKPKYSYHQEYPFIILFYVTLRAFFNR